MTTTIYSPDRTALLIVDPLNDFMSERGECYEATRQTAGAVGFYGNMRRLIPAVRAAGIPAIVVPPDRWRAGDYHGWKHVNPTQVQAAPYTLGPGNHGDDRIRRDCQRPGLAVLRLCRAGTFSPRRPRQSPRG